MAQACETCGGVGYGMIDPEFGWRRGSEKGQPPIPCPTCQGRFATFVKNKSATTVVDGKEVGPRHEMTFGPWIEPRTTRTVTIDVVGGGDPSQVSDQEFDPGLVNTGSEKVSIEEALAATAGEG